MIISGLPVGVAVHILSYLDDTELCHVEEANVLPDPTVWRYAWRARRPSICAGDGVSVIIEKGRVYTCGYGGKSMGHGNLGHGDRKGQLVPKLVTTLKTRVILNVAAGGNHSLFLTNEGQVYSSGCGDDGRLGHGDKETQLVPKLVVALEGRRIVQVAAGGNHSLFLAKEGHAYSCGYGDDGRLGHGDKETQLAPKLVAALETRVIVQVAAGGCHSLFLAKEGHVYSCGHGLYGQLGHGDKETQLVPKLVAALETRVIVQVAAGDQHVLYLTKGGAVLSCGLGHHMELGHGDEKDQLVPKLIAALEGTHIVQVAAGYDHSLFLAKGGAVLSCGLGVHGELGHGDGKSRLVPTQVTRRVP